MDKTIYQFRLYFVYYSLWHIALDTCQSRSSPISAPPYVLSLVDGMPLTMGEIVIMMHVAFIIIQIVLLRKDFQIRQLSQIFVSFLFGFYTDVTMWMTSFLQIPQTLPHAIGWPLQFVELLVGGALLAFGIACEVRCDSLMLAGEGLPLAISKVVKKEFGKVKMCSDTMLVAIAVVLMFIFFPHLELEDGWCRNHCQHVLRRFHGEDICASYHLARQDIYS